MVLILLAGVRVISTNATRVSLWPRRRGQVRTNTSLSTFLRPYAGDSTPRAYLENTSIFELVELNISNTSESSLEIGSILQYHRHFSWKAMYH
jgi:hypothetical protein